MPQFDPGQVKTAVAPITVKPAGLNCETELYLVSNSTKVATAGIKPFISTGAKQDISFPITMPAPGTYPVYLDVVAQGMLIGAYKAIEDVIIAAPRVTVTLWNPPSGATMWQLVLCDQNITVAINQIGGTVLNDVAEPIAFEIPSGVKFPLRIVSLQVSKWNADRTAISVLYEIQSYHPFLWDFDRWDWSTTPDPTYRAVFIPSYGSYYYAVGGIPYEYYITGDDGKPAIYGVRREAQTFTPATAHKIASVRLKLYRLGLPGTLTIGIRATDVNGHPTGADLCSGTIDGNTIATDPTEAGAWYEITLGAGYDLVAGTKYAIVATIVGGWDYVCVVWRVDESSSAYVGGNREQSGNSGITWTTLLGHDFMFEECGAPLVLRG